MSATSPALKKNYLDYLEKLRDVDLNEVAPRLGISTENPNTIFIFDEEFTITDQGITGIDGRQPSYDICVVLAKYILMCPDAPPKGNDWVAFRHFKDAGPLAGYFTMDISNRINSHFTGKADTLKKAGREMGGFPPDIPANYDVKIGFNALPNVPVVLLFNDKDEDFGAQTKILFESRADQYLDVECLIILCLLLCKKLEQNA